MNASKPLLLSLTMLVLASMALGYQDEPALPELTKNERKAIEKEIESYYQVKRVGWGPVKVRVEAPSIVLSVQAHGLRCETGGDGFYSSTVKDGEVIELAAQGAVFHSSGFNQSLGIGTRVFITEVDVEQEHVLFYLRTVDGIQGQINGTTSLVDCQGGVRVLYDETRSAAGVMDSLRPVLMTEQEVESLPPKTVSLGQSPDEVEASFGKPKQVIDLGAKKIFVYDSIKVVFVDGQVSDVQ